MRVTRSESSHHHTYRAPPGSVPRRVGLIDDTRAIWVGPHASVRSDDTATEPMPTYRTVLGDLYQDATSPERNSQRKPRIQERARRVWTDPRWTSARGYAVEQLRAAGVRLRRATGATSQIEFWDTRVWLVAIIGGLLSLSGVLIALLLSSPLQAPLPMPVAGVLARSQVSPPAIAVAPPAPVRSADSRGSTLAKEPVSKPAAKPRTAQRRDQQQEGAGARGHGTPQSSKSEREMAENLIGSFASGGFPGTGR